MRDVDSDGNRGSEDRQVVSVVGLKSWCVRAVELRSSRQAGRSNSSSSTRDPSPALRVDVDPHKPSQARGQMPRAMMRPSDADVVADGDEPVRNSRATTLTPAQSLRCVVL